MVLAGASGPFEIIESMMGAEPRFGGNKFMHREVLPLIQSVLGASLENRFKLKGMPEKRADLSLESMLLIDTLLDLVPSIENIIVTTYALKEGYILKQYF